MYINKIVVDLAQVTTRSLKSSLTITIIITIKSQMILKRHLDNQNHQNIQQMRETRKMKRMERLLIKTSIQVNHY